MKGRVVDWAKRFLWLPWVVVLLLAGPLAAEEPTPLTAVLPAGEVTTIACLSPYGARQNVPDWPPDGIFHYRLYLPSDYHDQPARQYPLMFIASPGGEARMGHMAERLTRDRWVVAMLAESRNRSVLWYPNFMATYNDVLKRVRVHPEMLFCTGFSGGARVCSHYPSIRPGFQGLILQAAGYSGRAWVLTRSNAHVTVYGLFGARDPNRREARRIRRGLPLHTRNLVEIWDGGHAWAPAPVFERALDWVEDKALLEAEYDAGLADVYGWYFMNKLARFERATSDAERYVLRRLLKTLPERWHLELDEATRERFQAVDTALRAFSEDDALQREVAAYDAFDKTLRADEAQRVGDLSEIIQQYGEIADRYPNTQFGQRALMRQQSVHWEMGAP